MLSIKQICILFFIIFLHRRNTMVGIHKFSACIGTLFYHTFSTLWALLSIIYDLFTVGRQFFPFVVPSFHLTRLML